MGALIALSYIGMFISGWTGKTAFDAIIEHNRRSKRQLKGLKKVEMMAEKFDLKMKVEQYESIIKSCEANSQFCRGCKHDGVLCKKHPMVLTAGIGNCFDYEKDEQ